MTLWCAALFAAQLSSTTLSDVRLPAGESRDQVVAAEAGEYLSVAVEAKDFGVDAEVVMPDGAVMRRFGRLTPGRLTVTFVAPASGDYRIRLTAPRSSDGGQISIRIAERMSLEQRAAIRPTPLKGAVITALEQELKAGKMRDTTAFWNRIAGSRTPVVETLAETSDVQVTFLWRGTPDTRNVVVVGSLSLPPGFRNNVMSRLGDTDVWFLTK